MAKYHNIPVVIDGITFASKAEGRRYRELNMLLRIGLITDLVCHKRFDLRVNGVFICTYECDFSYLDKDGREVVEDVKGIRTRDYRLKAKLMIACHGLRVIEVLTV